MVGIVAARDAVAMSAMRLHFPPFVRGALLASAGALALAPAAHAATITVNTKADDVAVDGHCSLREAITAANLDAPSGDAAGECAAGSGADVVALPTGHYSLTRLGADEDANDTGDLDLRSSIELNGAGADRTTIDGIGHDRVLDIAAGDTVRVARLSIIGGQAPSGATGPDGSATSGNGGNGEGGGGILNAGDLTVTLATLAGNTAGSGGAAGKATAVVGKGCHAGSGGVGGLGGGIYNTGSLTLDRAVVRGNAAGAGGAGGIAAGSDGIDAAGGNLDGHAAANADGGDGGAGGSGGGIWNANTFSATGSTLSDNDAGAGGLGGGAGGGQGGSGSGNGTGGHGGSTYGADGGPGGNGGASAGGGPVVLSASTISDNRAGTGGAGGGVWAGFGGVGGMNGSGGDAGIAEGGMGGTGGGGGGISAGSLTASNTTFDHNVAGAGGAGAYAHGGVGGLGVGAGMGGSSSMTLGGQGGGGGDGGALGAGSATLAQDTLSGNRTGAGGLGGTFSPGAPGNGGAGGKGFGYGAMAKGTNGLVGDGGVLIALNLPAHIDGSIMSNNVPASCAGTVTGSGDVAWPAAFSACPGDQVDPALAPLSDRGGPVATRALGYGSGALDHVPAGSAACLPVDARGVARPAGGACDAGAYESAPPAAVTGVSDALAAASAHVTGSAAANAAAASFHFEYGTTTAYGLVSGDGDVAGGAGAVPVAGTLAGLLPGTTYHYRLVVDSDEGTTVGADATLATPSGGVLETGVGSGPDRTAPVLSKASFLKPTFAVGPKSAKPTKSAAKLAKKASKGGTTLRFTLSETATVVVTVARKLTGHAAGKACKGKPRCVIYKTGGTLSIPGAKAGASATAFTGRFGRKQAALPVGTYRATIVATDPAGNHSAPFVLAFTIKRR